MAVQVRVVNVKINNAKLMLPSETVHKAFAKAAGRTRDRAKLNLTNAGRIDTGLLRNSITYEIQSAGAKITATVGTKVSYAEFIHGGTAGNGAGFIYPRRATMLRFKPKGGTGFVFARKVRGIKATPFIADAIKDLTEADFTVG